MLRESWFQECVDGRLHRSGRSHMTMLIITYQATVEQELLDFGHFEEK
jgi:hypothetical protein